VQVEICVATRLDAVLCAVLVWNWEAAHGKSTREAWSVTPTSRGGVGCGKSGGQVGERRWNMVWSHCDESEQGGGRCTLHEKLVGS
jgi:hypothetical protein